MVSVTVKPFDGVEGQNGLESGGNGSGSGFPVFWVERLETLKNKGD